MTKAQATSEAATLVRMGYDVRVAPSPLNAGQYEIRCTDNHPKPLYGLHQGDATRLCLMGLVAFKATQGGASVADVTVTLD